jgi:hypothetical protein
MEPVKQFEEALKITSFVKQPNKNGIVPENKFVETSKTSNFDNVLISVGICPVKQLLRRLK